MVTVIYGKAGSGKTSYIFSKMRAEGEAGGKSLLIVPEQYSHDAERQLCRQCGNKSSIYAEVVSFSRLCTRVYDFDKGGQRVMDSGGRILVMSMALSTVAGQLRAFGNAGKKEELAKSLISVYDEMCACKISPEKLAETAENSELDFCDKLSDLALIFAAYEAKIPDAMRDPAKNLDILAEKIFHSAVGKTEKLYIDGFTDFTAQQTAVLRELIKKGSDMTFCLTCGDIFDPETEFELTGKTARQLLHMAKDEGVEIKTQVMEPYQNNKHEEIAFLADNLFSFGNETFSGEVKDIGIFKASSKREECEKASEIALRLVRECGYRWHDIAISVRGWDEWENTAENVFEQYGIPIQTAKRSDILEKPVMTLVFSALDVIINDWDYKSVFRYLKTGITGVEVEDTDVLENYVIKWNIRGRSAWAKQEDWQYNPEGYVNRKSENDEIERMKVNAARRLAAKPLIELGDALRKAPSADKKIRALYTFLEKIELPERIEEKAAKLRMSGRLQLADEYIQLWEILVSGMEQFCGILGDATISNEDFAGLLKTEMGQYSVGTIPAAIDRVSVGDMTRMKKRDIKCLIIMGMTEDNVPRIEPSSGLLTDDERDRLTEAGVNLGDTTEDRISREMNLVYTCVSLPSDKLFMLWNTSEGRGRASFAVLAAERLFGIKSEMVTQNVKLASALPLFEASLNEKVSTPEFSAARKYFESSQEWKLKFKNAETAAKLPRGALGTRTAQKLYGKNISVTASRVDKFFSCRFAYFMQYGLKVRSRKKAGFDAPEAGTFIHFLLEKVANEAEKAGGFATLGEEKCRVLTKNFAKEYVETTLGGMKDKTSRFQYLFSRLSGDAETVVLDVADELSRSDFRPVAFELNFARGGDMPPAELSDGERDINVVGTVDRADGWLRGDKLYLRVVDYKTGKKEFSLSDIWYGLGMQMLIYLFVLQKSGEEVFGHEIIPAGIMYSPARDIIMPMPKTSSDEEIERARADKLRRSGLILADPDVIEAMEHGNATKYIPVKFKKDGSFSEDKVAGLDKLGMLSRHIDKTLLMMAKDLSEGSIDADPYYRGAQDNACLWCDYFEACHFEDGKGTDRVRYLKRLKTAEVWDQIEKEGK